jgi:hypothetical protein
MAFDAELADQIRFLIGAEPGVTEKKMFGGLAFLIGGNMAISASGQGGALVRVDPAESAALCQTTTATMAVMGGREMPGWLRISPHDLEADDQLSGRVSRAPPKRPVTATEALAPGTLVSHLGVPVTPGHGLRVARSQAARIRAPI